MSEGKLEFVTVKLADGKWRVQVTQVIAEFDHESVKVASDAAYDFAACYDKVVNDKHEGI
jgi:hypothetical protein